MLPFCIVFAKGILSQEDVLLFYTYSTRTNISRNQRSQINAVAVSGGSTAPPAPPSYTASYTAPPAPPAPPYNESYNAPPNPAPPYTESYNVPPNPAPPYTESYNVPPNPAPSYTVPPAPNTSTSVPISMLAPHADLSADEPPLYSSLPQQSAEAVQQCDVQNQVEAMAAVQIPPGIVCAVSDNSEIQTSRDQELSPRPRNQELPLPSHTGPEMQTETVTIEFHDNCTQEDSTP